VSDSKLLWLALGLFVGFMLWGDVEQRRARSAIFRLPADNTPATGPATDVNTVTQQAQPYKSKMAPWACGRCGGNA
jgi:hypothetical protein